MTLEKLLECDAAKLEAMSDEDLQKHFEPYFNITRPERASLTVVKQEKELAKTNPKLLAGINLAKQLGIDLGDSLTRTTKRKK